MTRTPIRRSSWWRRGLITGAVAVVALAPAYTDLPRLGGPAVATAAEETPAQRCERETNEYNENWTNAWLQAWLLAHPDKTEADAPTPPTPTPPYICHDPGENTTESEEPETTTTTTPAPTTSAAPELTGSDTTTVKPGPGTRGVTPSTPRNPLAPVDPGQPPITVHPHQVTPPSSGGPGASGGEPGPGEPAPPRRVDVRGRAEDAPAGDPYAVRGGECNVRGLVPTTPTKPGMDVVPTDESMHQGSMNDCWLLATIMGYEVSQTGRDGLARLVTPTDDGGYDVRFAVDGACQVRHVTKTFDPWGVQGQQIAKLFESAASQTESDAVTCEGALPARAQALFSGGGQEWKRDGSMPLDHKVRDRLVADRDDINSRIQNGSSVVLGTGGKDWTTFGSSVRTSDGTVVDGLEVTVAGKHAYVVTEATDHGVWVRNPWGFIGKYSKDDSAKQHAEYGNAEFFIPTDQIEQSFSTVSVSSPIGESPCLN